MKKSSSTNKGALWLAMIAMIAMIAFVGCPADQTPSDVVLADEVPNKSEEFTNDTTNVKVTQSPVSLAAPELKGEAFNGVNYVTWSPVKNATGYRLYRDNKYLEAFAYNTTSLEYYDYASLSTTIDSIKDGQSYTYTVVATGVQASRGTNSNVTEDDEFVMNGDAILGDSIASVTIKAKVPEVFSTVEAAKNVKGAYINDVARGKVIGVYFTKPAYLQAGVRFAHAQTGSDADIFTYFAKHGTGDDVYLTQNAGSYSWIPAYAGEYSFQVMTAWPNAFYQSAIVDGTVKVPSLNEKKAPKITATDSVAGITITFTDTVGAEYTLYRALEEDKDTTYTFEVVATGNTWDKTICSTNTSYSYLDKDVVYGKKYVYMLTGALNDKALVFDSTNPAVAFTAHSEAFTWNPQFAAINKNGTVSLSWNVEKDITYKVLKCTYASSTATTHTEEYLNNGAAINVGSPTLGVYVMTDTITKLAGTGYYKYTLIGENRATKKTSDSITAYNAAAPTFTFTVVGGRDTDSNGIYDKVVLALTADKTITDKPTFYKAEVDADNVTTSAGTEVEFLEGYKTVNLTLDASTDNGNGTITYTYLDNTQTEESIAMKEYVYAVKAGAYSDNDLCTLCNGDLKIPNVIANAKKYEGSDYDSFKDTYTLGWNAEYATTIGDSTVKNNLMAAVITVSIAYSDAATITAVKDSEWTTKTVKASEFKDYTYVQEFTVGFNNKKADGTPYHYVYYKVLFANKKYAVATNLCPTYANYVQNVFGNRAYQTTTPTEISEIIGTGATELYKTNTETTKACVIKTTGKLDASAYTVYVTWLTDNAIWTEPQKLTVSGANANVLPVIQDSGAQNESHHYFVDTNQNSFYFTNKPSDDTLVTRALVHVTNNDGNTLRSVIINTNKWW